MTDQGTTIGGAARLARSAAIATMVVAFALAVGLRAWRIDADPLWLDEAYSAYAADRGFAFLWRVVPAYETHPPVYYSLVRLWSLAFGDALLARRMLGLVAGVAAVPLLALAARDLGRLAGWEGARTLRLAAFATALAAVQPHMVLMARQLRPYPVMVAVYAAGLWVVLRLGRDAAAGRPLRIGLLAAFTAAEAAMLWLHTLGPLFGAAMLLALLAVAARRTLPRRDLIAIAATQAVAALLYAPAFLIMLGQAPTWIASTWLRFSFAKLPTELAYLYINWHAKAAVLGLAAAALGLVALGRRSGPGRRAALAVAAMATLPTLATILLSATISPVFLTRTLSATTMPALLLIAAGLAAPRRWQLATLPVAAYLIGSSAVLTVRIERWPPMQDWYGTIDWLRPRWRPGDVVWAYPNEGALPLGYALRDRRTAMAVRPIPAAVPAFGMGYYPTGSRGVVSLYPPQIEALVRTPAARTPPTIWLLRLGAWKYDPGDRLLRALARERRVVAHFRQRQIDLIGLRRVAPDQAIGTANSGSALAIARWKAGRSAMRASQPRIAG